MVCANIETADGVIHVIDEVLATTEAGTTDTGATDDGAADDGITEDDEDDELDD